MNLTSPENRWQTERATKIYEQPPTCFPHCERPLKDQIAGGTEKRQLVVELLAERFQQCWKGFVEGNLSESAHSFISPRGRDSGLPSAQSQTVGRTEFHSIFPHPGQTVKPSGLILDEKLNTSDTRKGNSLKKHSSSGRGISWPSVKVALSSEPLSQEGISQLLFTFDTISVKNFLCSRIKIWSRLCFGVKLIIFSGFFSLIRSLFNSLWCRIGCKNFFAFFSEVWWICVKCKHTWRRNTKRRLEEHR